MYPAILTQFNANFNHTPVFPSNNTAMHTNMNADSTNDTIRNAMQRPRSYGNTVNTLLFNIVMY